MTRQSRCWASLPLLAVCLAALVCACVAIPPLPRSNPTVLRHQLIAHSQWRPTSAPAADQLAPLSIVLNKQNIAAVEELLMRVSDPRHAEYGQYKSAAELQSMMAPDADVVAQWDAWARAQVTEEVSAAGGSMSWNRAGDILHLRLPVAHMEKLIGHALMGYSHESGTHCLRASVTSEQLLGRDATALASDVLPRSALPRSLLDSVSYVAGVTHFPLHVEVLANRATSRGRRFEMQKLSPLLLTETDTSADAVDSVQSAPAAASTRSDEFVSMSSVGVPPDAFGEQEIMQHVLVSSGDRTLQLGLFLTCTTPVTGGAKWADPMVLNGKLTCMGASYTSTSLTLSHGPAGSVISVTKTYTPATAPLYRLRTTGQVFVLIDLPVDNYVPYTLSSITFQYGAQSTSFDYPFSLYASTNIVPLLARQLYGVPDRLGGWDSLTPINGSVRSTTRTSIAALAISESNMGYFSRSDIATFLDANRIDPFTADARSGLLQFTDSTRPKPLHNDEFTPDLETTLDISLAMGANNETGLVVAHVGPSSPTIFEDMLSIAFNDPDVHVLSISYGADETAQGLDVRGLNTMMAALGARGVSVLVSSGDTGAYLENQGCARFAPNWPASSPWVTSVGATTLAVGAGGDASTRPTEIVCSLESSSGITGGGGFSALYSQPRPAYQNDSVESWLSSPTCPKPAREAGGPNWSRTGRAFPDLSLLGHNWHIVFQGAVQPVDGTSASAPALAGIIGAYNLVRMAHGMHTLGFLNYRLYQAAANDSRSFNDVTQGSNRCMMGSCCPLDHAFQACAGFDPVSGLGSPNFKYLAPFLIPDTPDAADQQVSNYFFPMSAGYAPWPASPVWPYHAPADKKSKDNTEAIVIGVALAVCILGVAICGFTWWWQFKRRPSPSAANARAAANASGMPAGGGRAVGAPSVAVAAHWGPGRVLGAASPSPSSPNDLGAPLAGGLPSDFNQI